MGEIVEINPYPEWLDQELWNDYLAYRKEIKSPLTKTGEKRALRKLRKLMDEGGDMEAIVERTIDSGKWKGLFQCKPEEDFEKVPNPKDMDALVAYGKKMGVIPKRGEEAYPYYQRVKEAVYGN